MKMKTKRGKLVRALSMALGVGCGLLMAAVAFGMEGMHLLNYLVMLAVLLWLFIFSTIIHECGHLIGGLKSGYRFVKFSIGALTWMKAEGGKVRFARIKTPGAAGQCLMSPPELIDGVMPFAAYHLSGVIANGIAAVVSGVVGWIVWAGAPTAALIWWMFVLINVIGVVTNGIPLPGEALNNDGYNYQSMCEDKDAIALSWRELKIAEQNFRGVAVKDMPEEWFFLPTDEQMKNNPRYANAGLYYYSRLVGNDRIEEAAQVIERMLEIDAAVSGMQKLLMRVDLARCEMLGQRRLEVIQRLLNAETRKLMKQLKKSLFVPQTEYMYAALVEHDEDRMAMFEAQFEKVAKHYPIQSDVERAREEMAKIREQMRSEEAPTGKITISFED